MYMYRNLKSNEMIKKKIILIYILIYINNINYYIYHIIKYE